MCHTDLIFWTDVAEEASKVSQIWRILDKQKLKTLNAP